MIKEKILNAYQKLRNQHIFDDGTEKFMVVVKITPESFIKLREEADNYIIGPYYMDHLDIDVWFINLFELKIPVLISHILPNDAEFIIQSQSDYEKEEKQKLYDRFNKMFRYWRQA